MYKLQRKYESPEFSEFPESEYEMRLKKAQETMEERNIDTLLLTQKENLEYFTGYMTTHWGAKGFAIGAALIPKVGEPVLIIPSFLRYTAEKTSWVKDIRGLEASHTVPRRFPDVVITAIKEKRLDRGVIGIEIGPHVTVQMPLVDFDKVRSSLKNAKFVSGADVIWGARTIKSHLELERIKKACEITRKAYDRLFQEVKAGMTEQKISAIFRLAILEEGGDVGFTNIRAGSERYPMADTFPYDRKIRKGDMLIVDAGGAYRGYICDICRVGVVGKPTAKHKLLYETCVKAQKAGLEALKPGVKAGEVFKASMAVMKAAKVKLPVLDLIGHGIGLDVHEPPIICDGGLEVLRPETVLCVEPWIYDWYGLGVFAVEDQVVVTEKGFEVLAAVEKEELWTIET